MSVVDTLAARLQQHFGDKLDSCTTDVGEATIEVSRANMLDVFGQLRDEKAFAFEIMIDLCGVDYSALGMDEWQTRSATGTGFSRGVSRIQVDADEHALRRFAVVYHLLSISNNQRLRVRVFAEDDDFPVVDTVKDVWAAADWYEREAFDMYGIVFEGHPDLRRLLTDYGFIGHPFRKDFPLSGHVEMIYDEEKKRVVYQPVSIEPRVLVPRVIRHDHRYDKTEETGEKGDA
jgi:NADH-quinone oxidoreductase subunit C